MAGLKTFLPTTGVDAGDLFDEDGNKILITGTVAREAIAGAVVPVDIGTRPNANDGDPLRTSFSKLNNFVLASYQNDSDVQERVSALEAGAVFLGVFRADLLPRRGLPLRETRPWDPSQNWPIGATPSAPYDDRNPGALPDLTTNRSATPVLAMISRPIGGRPNLSVVIDNIRDTTATNELTLTIVFPSATDGLANPGGTSSQMIIGGGGTSFAFPAIVANIMLGTVPLNPGDPDTRTADGIVDALLEAIQDAEVVGGVRTDYFNVSVEAPTDDTRRLIINFNFKAAADVGTQLPALLATFEQSTGGALVYAGDFEITSNGNALGSGIDVLPWIDQNITIDPIPAYTIFEWSLDGWRVAANQEADIKSEFLFFDDNEADRVANRDLRLTIADATVLLPTVGGNDLREITADVTRDAITDVQEFGINYVHSVTIDAGEY